MKEQGCKYVAESWEKWCGSTPWSENLKELGELGGKIIWYCGYPQSASAIPLCFVLVMPSGEEFGHSKLKDIKKAIRRLR